MQNMHRKVCLFLIIGITNIPSVYGAATPYGKDFHKYMPSQLKPSPIEKHVKKIEQITRQLIVDLKNDGSPDQVLSNLGPYASELIEPQLKKGFSHLKHGEKRDALTQFLKVLHLVRVTEGLYSKNQKTIIRHVQAVYYLLKDFKAIDQTYEYLFHLNGGERSLFDRSKFEFILEYLQWRRNFIIEDLEAKKEDLLGLYELNNRLLDEVNSNKDLSLEWGVQLSISQLSNLYLIFYIFGDSLGGKEIIFRDEFNSIDYRYGQSKLQRLTALAGEAASTGRRLLEKKISNPKLDSVNRFYLQIALGDWFQWQKRSRIANRYYREAYQLSAGLNDTKLKNFLSTPVELPDNEVFLSRFSLKGNNRVNILSVDFDVLNTGQVSNIKITEIGLLEKRQAKSFRRKLKNIRFRPEFRDGKPVTTIAVNRKYEVF